jgi:hypothetical protein
LRLRGRGERQRDAGAECDPSQEPDGLSHGFLPVFACRYDVSSASTRECWSQ